jgi:hypothetical protein
MCIDSASEYADRQHADGEMRLRLIMSKVRRHVCGRGEGLG